MTAALIMGSVGVKHAEMTSDETKSNLGKRKWMVTSMESVRKGDIWTPACLPADTIHPNAIVGTTIITRLLACSAIYLFASSTPMAKRPVASTIRIISRVRVSVMLVQERG